MRTGGASVPARAAVLVGILLLLVVSLASGSVMLVPLFAMPALFIIPALLFRGPGDAPAEGNDTDGGGGGGPRRPQTPERPPGTGPPLPDADQARARVRDHIRGRLAPSPARRGAPRGPVRKPIRPGR